MIWRRLSLLLLMSGILLTVKPFYFYTKGFLAQVLLDHAWDRTTNNNSPQLAWPWANTYPVGKIHFPKLNEEFTILDGTRPEALAFGPGLVENTAYPGEPGNICIAGHRDSFFKNIKDLGIGDIIWIEDIDTTQLFQVEYLRVVKPENTKWLAHSDSTILTLITCYPFNYIGDAPDRYILRARLVNN